MEQSVSEAWGGGPGPVYYGLTSSYLAVVALVGLTLNTFYGVMFIKEKSFRTPIGYLFLNLCISDLIISVASLVKFAHTVLRTRLEAGDLLCNLFGFLTFIGGEGALYSLTAISIYRCMVVTNVTDPNVLRPRKVVICMCCIWTQALVFACAPLLGLNRFVPENPGTWCSLEWTNGSTPSLFYLCAIFTCSFFIPTTIMITSYTRIWMKIKEISRAVGQSSQAHHAERSLTKSCLLMATCFVASWSPYAILSICSLVGLQKPLSPYILIIPPLMCKASACFDPFIYLCTVPEVGRFIRKYQQHFRKWRKPPRKEEIALKNSLVLHAVNENEIDNDNSGLETQGTPESGSIVS